MAEESKMKRTESESYVSNSDSSSSESDGKPIQCLMVDDDLEISNDEVFNFSSEQQEIRPRNDSGDFKSKIQE